MREFHTFVSIADIHIGMQRISPEEIKRQLKEHFFDVIKKFRYLDGIFICGDILHTGLTLSSEYSNVYIWFINRVYSLARKKNATVIIVRGTISHDGTQLSILKPFEQSAIADGVDFRVYDTVEEITIWDNYKVLVLPDVRVKQLKDIDQYLKTPNQYDLILGHGLTDSMQFFVQESENFSTKSYVFDIDTLMRSSKGPVMFGHIHQSQSVANKFYYTGSFTTLERGVYNPGYLVGAIYDKDREKYVVNRYNNPDGADYYDITVTKELFNDYPIDDIIAEINEIVSEMKPNDLMTLRLIKSDEVNAADKILMIESAFRKDRRISIQKKVKTKREEEVEQKNKELRDKYAYAWDTNLEMWEITWKYYVEDILPTLDESSVMKKLTEDDFRRVLSKDSQSAT